MQNENLNLEKKLKLSFVLNTGFAFFEIFVGIVSGSLALVSDAAHNLTDSLSILIAWAGQKLARRPATREHTFGYGKATILTAMANSLILIAVALFIFYEAYRKIISPQPVKGLAIMLTAGAGIIINGAVAAMFAKNRDNLNTRGVFLNMFFDTLVSVGALAAGAVIYFTGSSLADPIISIVIGLMLIVGSGKIINEAVHILLEGVPENIKYEEVEKFIAAVPGVANVHDLHVWSIASQKVALDCHIVPDVYEISKNLELVKTVKDRLKEKYDISHCTIEIEDKICQPHEH